MEVAEMEEGDQEAEKVKQEVAYARLRTWRLTAKAKFILCRKQWPAGGEAL